MDEKSKQIAREAFRHTKDQWYDSGFRPDVDWDRVFESWLEELIIENKYK